MRPTLLGFSLIAGHWLVGSPPRQWIAPALLWLAYFAAWVDSRRPGARA